MVTYIVHNPYTVQGSNCRLRVSVMALLDKWLSATEPRLPIYNTDFNKTLTDGVMVTSLFLTQKTRGSSPLRWTRRWIATNWFESNTGKLNQKNKYPTIYGGYGVAALHDWLWLSRYGIIPRYSPQNCQHTTEYTLEYMYPVWHVYICQRRSKEFLK